MLAYEDVIGMAHVNETEAHTIAELEHLPDIIAIALGSEDHPETHHRLHTTTVAYLKICEQAHNDSAH
jgi:hypothetical protein